MSALTDVVDAQCAEIESLRAQLAEAQHKLQGITACVSAQACDEGLWFQAEYVTEAYLQAALRRLHAVIEDAVPDYAERAVMLREFVAAYDAWHAGCATDNQSQHMADYTAMLEKRAALGE